MDPDSYLSTFLTSIEVLPITSGGIFALFMAFLCLVFSGFVSASEIAFFSLSPQDQAEIEEEKKTQDVLIKNLLARSEYLLATILIANNLVNVAVVMLCNFFISETIIFRSPVISFLFQVVILTFLLLLFGEIMPKIYAKHNSLTMARRAAGVLTHLEKMFRWLSWALIKSTHIINKHISRKNTNLSMNELSQALEMTQVDENEEKEMLEGIIKFGGKTVEEIMTSRVDMTDIDIRISLSSLIKIIVETGYSRLPVYEGSQDNIKGIIYIKDLLPYIKEKDFDWSSLLRPAYFVPETKMIDDLLEEIQVRIEKDERVLVTTLTKRMAEELNTYLLRLDIRCNYIHSDVDTLERIQIIEDLRNGLYDVLIGVNLLREGLDLPEVSLVAILDADKEGFLRSHRSLTQTAGRAARNLNGMVIMYADKITESMQKTIDETNRRREKQLAYNEANHITPQAIQKARNSILTKEADVQTEKGQPILYKEEYDISHVNIAADPVVQYMNKDQLKKAIENTRKAMVEAAKRMEFIEAAQYRDELVKLQNRYDSL